MAILRIRLLCNIVARGPFSSKVDRGLCISSYARLTFCSCDLDLDPMTLTYELEYCENVPAYQKWNF